MIVVRRLLVCALALICATATAGADPPDANVLFANVARAAAADSYPRFASYQVTVSYQKSGEPVTRTWGTTEDLARGVVRSDIFSLEEEANPATPHGTNFSLGLLGQTITDSFTDALNHIRETDPVGAVAFAVDQRFGLARHAAYRATSDDSTFDAAAKEAPLIGRTATVERLYDASWIDSDGTLDHIKLVPILDPDQNRLRELWFDDKTFQVKTAIVAGIGNRPPTSRVYWQIDFERHEGGTYIAWEQALGNVSYGRDGVLEDMTIAFDHIALSTYSPLKTTFGLGTPIDRLRDP